MRQFLWLDGDCYRGIWRDEPVPGGMHTTTVGTTAVNSKLDIAAVGLGVDEPEAAVDTAVLTTAVGLEVDAAEAEMDCAGPGARANAAGSPTAEEAAAEAAIEKKRKFLLEKIAASTRNIAEIRRKKSALQAEIDKTRARLAKARGRTLPLLSGIRRPPGCTKRKHYI